MPRNSLSDFVAAASKDQMNYVSQDASRRANDVPLQIQQLLGNGVQATSTFNGPRWPSNSISQQAQRVACAMEPHVAELKQRIEDTLCPFGFEIYPFQVGLSLPRC